jgi:major membrane immunogen (membrane-anchored lipoprotein)
MEIGLYYRKRRFGGVPVKKALISALLAMLVIGVFCACEKPISIPSPAASQAPSAQVSSAATVTPTPTVSPSATAAPSPTVPPTFDGKYKDGSYTYTGPKDGEGYYVKASLIVKDTAIQSMDFQIIDSTGRVFDDKYEEIYAGNDMYIQQCRDNMKGIKAFLPQLLKVQNPDKVVDTVSGATWAYNRFEEAAKALLSQAK